MIVFVGGIYHAFNLGQKLRETTLINQQRIERSPQEEFPLPKISNEEKVAVFLTYGQSNAANFGALEQRPYPDVLELCDSHLLPLEEPSCGTGGSGGNPWGRLGRIIIEATDIDKVVFAHAAIGGKTLKYLRSDGALDYLERQHNQLNRLGYPADAILMLQGESDRGNGMKYEETFGQLLQKLKVRGIRCPIVLSQTSICGDHSSDSAVTLAQERITRRFPDVYLGPNSDQLQGVPFRTDFCHFNQRGLDSLAHLWYESIDDSEAFSFQ